MVSEYKLVQRCVTVACGIAARLWMCSRKQLTSSSKHSNQPVIVELHEKAREVLLCSVIMLHTPSCKSISLRI